MHTYIKCVNVKRGTFNEINDDICSRYAKLKNQDKISFTLFQRGILFAFMLGNLTAHNDKESLELFFSCLSCNHIPRIKILKESDTVKICAKFVVDKKICLQKIKY